jgi:GntR family transcriptional regulator
VNTAARLLRGEGLIRVIRARGDRGGGMFVRPIPLIIRDASGRYRKSVREQGQSRGAFDAEIRRLGMTPRSDVEVSRVAPPARVAETLGVPPGEPVIVRARRMYANDWGVQLAPSYIPLDVAEAAGLTAQDSGPGGMLSRLAEAGYAEVRMTETDLIRRATDEEVVFLGLDQDAPVREIYHVGWTAAGRPVEVCIHSVSAYGWANKHEWDVER